MEWIAKIINSFKTNNWMVDISFVLLFTCIAFVAWRIFAQKMEGLVTKTATGWDDVVWHAIWKPVNWLIAVAGLSLMAMVFAESKESALLEYIPVIRTLAISLLVCWAFLRFIHKTELRFIELEKDETTVTALGKLLRASVFIITALALFQALGFSISGVLAFGGVGGLVVGMAAKDLLANFFGALVIYMDRPFKVGDWIRSPDRNIEGTVEKIGWRLTMIRTFDKRPLYVPNAIFTQISVENPSRMSNRRIYETIGIRYDDSAKLGLIVRDVKAMLQEHPEIDTRQTLIVNFNSFGPSSLDFFIYTFTKTTDWIRFHEIKQDVLMQAMAVISKHNAEIAFPTQTLQIEALQGVAEPGLVD